MKKLLLSLSAIFFRKPDPVQSFGLALLHDQPLLSLFAGIGDGFWQRPDCLAHLNKGPANESEGIHFTLRGMGGTPICR